MQVRSAATACAKRLERKGRPQALLWKSVLQKEREEEFTHVGASGITCAHWNHQPWPDSSPLRTGGNLEGLRRDRVLTLSWTPLAPWRISQYSSTLQPLSGVLCGARTAHILSQDPWQFKTAALRTTSGRDHKLSEIKGKNQMFAKAAL